MKKDRTAAGNGGIMSRELEIREAIQAGNQALSALRTANDRLESAGNWGLFDMFTRGGIISHVIKHDRMDEARQYMDEARRALTVFRRELGDVEQLEDVSLDVGSFLSFADFFFDGLFVDWMVQSRIREAQRKISGCISQVERLTAQLRGLL